MYITSQYLGIKKGGLKYLFLLLIEEYQQTQINVRESLRPLIEDFGRNLSEHGAIVIPFAGHADQNLGNVLSKPGWRPEDSDIRLWFTENCPAVLVMDKDVDVFDPKNDPYIIISLRQSMDEFGNVKIFELK
jgi:hypothetical protein